MYNNGSAQDNKVPGPGRYPVERIQTGFKPPRAVTPYSTSSWRKLVLTSKLVRDEPVADPKARYPGARSIYGQPWCCVHDAAVRRPLAVL